MKSGGVIMRRFLIYSLSLFFCAAAFGATFTVDTDDGAGPDVDLGDGVCLNAAGECSLLAAVMQANVGSGSDTIAFAIAGGGALATITLTEPLPSIGHHVVIDGFTQGCPGPGPCIELVGTAIPGEDGLKIIADESIVRGLAIGSFATGIRLQTGDGIVIESNFIGTDASGTVPRGNENGILILSSSTGNLIGGATPDLGNRIAANTDDGIDMHSADNLIVSNVIGRDDVSPASLANLIGIRVTISGDSTIGAPGSGNVISGNQTGVWLAGSNVSGMVVQSNCIGPIQGCTTNLGNTQQGISVFSSQSNLIGGTGPGEGNIIGSNGSGVSITGDFADDNIVVGNFIGTDPLGVLALSNTDNGIGIGNGADGNVIGGSEPGVANLIRFNLDSGVGIHGGNGNIIEGNTISGNVEHGVEVSSGVGNTISENAIFANLELGIELGNDGVTPNDPGDADTGPNDFQNYPELTLALTDGVGTFVNGWLDSTPDAVFELEFFASDDCDPSGHGEGVMPLGSVSVTTDVDGLVSFGAALSLAAVDQVVSATATNADGSTSEFSLCRTVGPASAVGACCLAHGGCELRDAHGCPGEFLGEGTTCTPDPCGDVPASSGWSLVVLTVMLLTLGALSRRMSGRVSSDREGR